MEGPLSPVAWLMIVGSSGAGAWVYLAIRPYEGHWTRLIGMFMASSSIGVVVTPGLCETYSLTSIYQHILVAFFSALLGMPMCRGAVAVTESEAAGWLKKMVTGGWLKTLVLRVFGVKDDASPPKPIAIEDESDDGHTNGSDGSAA